MKTQTIKLQNKWRKDFPIFKNNPQLVYLDNAATSQKPLSVIEALKHFYEYDNANIHRGIYTLSEIASEQYHEARRKIAQFIHASPEEIVFTKNTTESINLLAYTLHKIIPYGKNEIVVSEMEHHSNLIPWQELCRRHNFVLRFIPLKNYELDYKKAETIINERTAIVAVTHVSNVFGTVNDVRKIVDLAKKYNVITVIDDAQSVAHLSVNVKELDCDFLVFSSHKLYGPLGVGVFYGKKELLKKLPVFLCGGGMIEKVSYEQTSFAEIPGKFEAGTQAVGEVIAFGKAVDYLENIGIETIEKYEKELLSYALDKLQAIEGIIIYNPGVEKSVSIVSFNLNNIHPHDVASLLNDYNIAVRAGHHCCMPLMKKLEIVGTCRVSLSFYNTKEDIDKLVFGLKKVWGVFKIK